MINTIKIPKEYYISNIIFPETIDFTLLPDKRIAPLFGPNGAGKTTILKAIDDTIDILSGEDSPQNAISRLVADLRHKGDEEAYLKSLIDRDLKSKGLVIESDGTPMRVLRYFNKSDNLRHRQARNYMESFDPFFIKGRWDAQSVSEGQSIVYSLFDLFDLIGTGKNALKEEGHQLLVLLDEIDSGLSLDNIGMFMRKLKNSLKKRNDIQVIFSFNNPYILEFFPDVVSMYDGTVVHMETAKDILNEIKKNKEMFNKARKKSDGRPRVFD